MDTLGTRQAEIKTENMSTLGPKVWNGKGNRG